MIRLRPGAAAGYTHKLAAEKEKRGELERDGVDDAFANWSRLSFLPSFLRSRITRDLADLPLPADLVNTRREWKRKKRGAKSYTRAPLASPRAIAT